MKKQDEKKTGGDDPVAFVDAILSEAVAASASDIYWIPAAESCSVRFRINGIQKELRQVRGSDFISQCSSRIKVLAGMLTYMTKISQDGAIRGFANFPDAELRVSAIPTVYGERISIRILHASGDPSDLENLGYSDVLVSAMRRMLQPSCGLIILTGPTGSGKTTAIYAMIRELLRNSQDPASIISIEDPIEKIIPGISQVSLTKKQDEWGYEDALRAVLRHDVKTIVIGEIRDVNVAKVVLSAALSGHRVITTLHAGDIPSVYARLLHQGFEPFLIASAITGILSQRLLPSKSMDRRIPVAAYLLPDDHWRDFVVENPGLAELRRKIQSYPGADIQLSAENMAGDGLIRREDLILI